MNSKLQILADRLKDDYYSFFCFFWPLISDEKLIKANHIKYICDELTILGKAIIKREKPEFDWYIINIPPGTSKSSIVSVLWPTWLLCNDPSIFIINSSYSDDLSSGFVRKSKRVINNPAFEQLFGKIEMFKETESFFETSKGGGRYATSTGGTITGYHGNVIIPDDPLSAKQSYSKAFRDSANNYNDTTLEDRVRSKIITPFVMVMQRLHDEDPTGHILAKGLKVKHICLPAELGPTTTEGLENIYTDGLLDPVRMPKEVLEKKKKALGSFAYAGQYDQNPHPEGGGKIKGKWFERIHSKELPAGITWDMWIDGAYTKSTKNDPTGLMICGIHENTLYIRHSKCAFLEMPDLLTLVPQYAEEFGFTGNSMVYIEPKASGKSLKQMLKQQSIKLNPIEIESGLVNEGKEARMNVASPKVEAGRVCLVIGGWNEEFIEQLEGFPTAKHDEYVDLLGYACEMYLINTFFAL